MLKPKYIFLTLSLIAFAVGFSDAQSNVIFYLGRPVGAILFGLYLIAQVLEKESALLDEQRREAEVIPPQPKSFRQEVAHNPALTTVHSH